MLLHSIPSRLAAAVLALLLVTVAACSPDEADEVADDPEAALSEAVEAVAEWQGIEIELRLDPDEAGQASLRDDEVTEEDVQLLLGGSVTARFAATDDPETNALELLVNLDEDVVAEVRVTDEDAVFLRLAVESLARRTEGTQLDTQDLSELIGAAELFGLGEAAEALGAGEWIELVGLTELMQLADESEQEADRELTEATAERIAQRTSQFVEEDVAVSRVGSDDVGERVRATTNGAALKRYLDDLQTEIDDGGLVEDATGQDVTDDLAELPDDAEVSIDAWIRDGELRQVAIDLAALGDGDELDGEVWLVVSLEEFTGLVETPADATPVDLFGLFGAFFGGGFEDDAGDDTAGDDAFDDTAGDDAFDDTAGDDGFDDDGFDDDDTAGDQEFSDECITEEELAEIEEFLGEDGLEEFQNLIDAGLLEVC
jgi:hypothetical protein